ncbi:MAG: MlaD family protein [Candidatus Omnitrophota bacterium]
MDKSKTELKVGIFVFVALVIFIVLILKISNLKNYGSGYQLKFVFNNISGVKPGSPVRFSGLDVGAVSRINIIKDPETKNTFIEIVAWIKRSLAIPENSQVYISTLGLLGEKYIEIIPASQYESFLKPGGTLIGTEPTLIQDWVDEVQSITEDLRVIINEAKAGKGTIGKLLNEDELYIELEGLISDLRQAREGTIGRLLYDDTLYLELEGLVRDIRRNPWKLFWKTK